MRPTFNKNIFLPAAIILSASWLLLNYLLFTSKGVTGLHPDFRNFLDWAWQGKHQYFYVTFGNYMPVYPYMSYTYTLFFTDYENMLTNAHLLKGAIILFDVFTYALIVSYVQPGSVKKTVALSMLIALNVSVVYNSVFWGQVDNIHSFFVLLCFYFTVHRKLIYVGIAFTFAIFSKIVSVIFLPVFGIYVLNDIICKRVRKLELVYLILAVFFTSLTISFPILISGNLTGMIATHKGFIEAYKSVSGNAYNVWVLVTNGRDLMVTSTSDLFFRNLTYQQVSMLLFVPFYSLAIWPLIWRVVKNIRLKKNKPVRTESLLLACILVPLVFFYFSTKIRERYSHPYVVFLTLYCFYNRRYLLWFFATSIYLLQLEAVLGYTKTLPNVLQRFHQETNIYSPMVISALFLALIVYLLHESFLHMIRTKTKMITLNKV